MVGESGIRPGEVDSDGNGIPDILENQECDCECHDGCKQQIYLLVIRQMNSAGYKNNCGGDYLWKRS